MSEWQYLPYGKPLDRYMDNVLASRLGEVVRKATTEPHGDLIDTGLILRRLLEEAGFLLLNIKGS